MIDQEKIKINGLTYSVIRTDQIDDSPYKKYGKMSSVKQEIRINNQLSWDRQSQTLVHELLHACIYEAGLCHMFEAENAEESLVNTLAPVLTGVIKQLDLNEDHRVRAKLIMADLP